MSDKRFSFNGIRARISFIKTYDQPYINKELTSAMSAVFNFFTEILEIHEDDAQAVESRSLNLVSDVARQAEMLIKMQEQLNQLEEIFTSGDTLTDVQEPEEVDSDDLTQDEVLPEENDGPEEVEELVEIEEIEDEGETDGGDNKA